MPQTSTRYVVLKGDWRNKKLWFGVPYTFRYRFSPACLRQTMPYGGYSPIIDGRTQVKQWAVDFANSLYFRSEVTPDYRDTILHPYTSKTLGEQSDAPGRLGPKTGTHKFRVQSKNDRVTVDIVNDSPFPCWLVSATWEGEYTSRARRV